MGMVLTIRAATPEDVAGIRGGGSAWDFLNADEASYLDKAWHSLHYLLCGDPWGSDGPLGQALMGGEAIGEDGGYGEARYLPPEEVVATAAALETVTTQVLRERFDPDQMVEEEIYPEIWHEPDAVDYPLGYLEVVKKLYAEAAAAGHGVIMMVS